MIAKIVGSSDAEWINFLDYNLHEFYQLPGYSELEREVVGAKLSVAYYFKSGTNEMLIPLILRDLPLDGVNGYLYDAKSPYGYPGILTSTCFDESSIQTALDKFIEVASNYGILTAFIRLNPIYNEFEIHSSDALHLKTHGSTVVIDLKQPLEIIKQSFSNNHKRNLKTLNKNGYVTKFNEWEACYSDFQSLYLETMRRVKSSDFYKFDESYFERLKVLLGEHLVLSTVHDSNGVVVCGGIFSNYNGIVQYHLGGTHPNYLKEAPTKKMFADSISYFKEKGAKDFHLGGGMGSREDSLFYFKLGFGGSLLQFRSLSVICNNPSYEKLNDLVLQYANKANYEHGLDYIPLYRTIEVH